MSQLLEKSWNHDFLYDETKTVFYQELQHVLLTHNPRIIYKSEDFEEAISQVKERQFDFHKTLKVKCFIGNINSKETLCISLTCDDSKKIKLITTMEEMFDVLAEIHISIFCLPVKVNLHTVPNVYIDPALIRLFLKSCRYCYVSRKCTWVSSPRKTVCEIGLIRIEQKDEDYRHILLYIDRESNYTLLRPLKKRTHEEVALELLNIFCDFGAPMFMNASLRMFTTKVLNILKSLNLPFDIPRLCGSSRCHKLGVMACQIKTLLSDWVQRSDCNNLIIGTHVVQWMLNSNKVVNTYVKSRFLRGVIDSPYHALFALLPNKELVNFRFKSDNVMRKLTSKTFAECSYCHQTVYKAYTCYICEEAFHIVCCERVLQYDATTPILITRCFSCTEQDSILKKYLLK